jgi:hypothetical protein
MNTRKVEKMVENGEWIETVFEELQKGEVVRFCETQGNKIVEQNGSSVFVVIGEAHPVGEDGNCKVSVIPFGAASTDPVLTECRYWENIVVKPQGMDKLIEATGYCESCPYMRACLRAKYSSAYFDQLRNALGFNDLWN